MGDLEGRSGVCAGVGTAWRVGQGGANSRTTCMVQAPSAQAQRFYRSIHQASHPAVEPLHDTLHQHVAVEPPCMSGVCCPMVCTHCLCGGETAWQPIILR